MVEVVRLELLVQLVEQILQLVQHDLQVHCE